MSTFACCGESHKGNIECLAKLGRVKVLSGKQTL